ncbi:GspH/FimT family pseudopilin [Pseudomonas sp. MS15a(2019)]|uniref:GspH/FimT family pseudopilin n=1 Tax=Pseudomonas sp. MS15a(2019) TaxID=2579938 RepID=UPI00156700CD|nr:GspH/FimT family pseudopilin [Pseudomonas sp. MS15a(2019)]NRH42953.1 prepilin-type N-terminal cleavage/methylation domain-containing protein [Pseudomonas sp. MS15a(2019)]
MRAQYGFTLIELMVAIAILAIVIAIAAPSFNRTVQSNRAAVMSNELVGALQTTRSEALKRRTNVTLCRRNADGSACEAGTDWSAGWLLIQESLVLRVWEPATGIALTGPSDGITYRNNGTTTLSAAETLGVATPSCRRIVTVTVTGNASANTSGCIQP